MHGGAMTIFGDYDPDDAWDASDNVVEQLRNIGERVAWIIEHRDAIELRVTRIVEDISYIRDRVIGGDV
jgi:hypothetical protein